MKKPSVAPSATPSRKRRDRGWTMNENVVDIADLDRDRLDVRGVLPAERLESEGADVERGGDIEWSGYLVRQGVRIRLAGSLAGNLQLACARCLEPSRVEVTREFDLFFEHRDDLTYEEHAEIELEEPDTRTAFLTGTELNLGDVIAEQVVLSLPMKPLCRNDCKGLCLECGKNLNVESCDCTVPPVNPAFDVLVALKDRMQGEKT